MKLTTNAYVMTALIALACVAKVAYAGDVGYAPNQANGAIVLTDDAANCASGSAYYMTDASGQVIPGGCWIYRDPWVVAIDFAGARHQWMADQFTITDYGKSKHHAPSASM